MADKKPKRKPQKKPSLKNKKEIVSKSTKTQSPEVFIKKEDGKERVVIKEGKEIIPKQSKNQLSNENKILKYILLGMLLFFLVFVGVYFYANSKKSFEWNGVKLIKVKQGEITFYQTSFPIMKNGKPIQYNVYLRKDPRVLEKTVPINGTLNFQKIMVIVADPSLLCQGYMNIAIQNLKLTQTMLGGKAFFLENESCDPQNRYTFFNITPSNETSIIQTSDSCYDIKVSNCEVLEGTERVLYGLLEEANKHF